MNESLDQLEAIQLGIEVDVVHPEVVEHQLLGRHLRHVPGYLHVLLQVTETLHQGGVQVCNSLTPSPS